MQRIMLATDFSERSDRALRRAVLLARSHGARLDLVHVVDDDRPQRIVQHEVDDARAMLRELARALERDDGVQTDIEIILSDPFAGIVTAAAERQPDLLVIGPHRRQILRDVFLGTTAERTIRAVSCPVLMVNGPPLGPWRHVLLTADGGAESRDALTRFVALSPDRSARRSLLHVFDAPALRLGMSGMTQKDDRAAYLEDQRADAMQMLERLLAEVPGLEAHPVLRQDLSNPAHEIHKAAQDLEADLIVVATQGKGALARLFLGSVTEKVLQSAVVDVLSLPPRRTGR